ncbi:MAG: S1 RNA-binding domain-containing protein [Chloroflexota bacterium]
MSSSINQVQASSQPDMARLLEQFEPIKTIKHGDVIAGTVMHIDHDGILVDTGHKSEGFVPSREMRSLSLEALSKLHPGDEVFAYVIQPDSEEEPALLSVDRARGEWGWLHLQKCLDNNSTIEGVIRGFNKGGAIVDVDGVQGFVPISQLAPLGIRSGEASQEDVLAQRVGQSIQMRLLELNRRRNRVILSERLALQQEREEKKNQLLAELQEGQVRKGRVSGLSSFGAFVDMGGADGLIHISELSWESVRSPEEVVQVGAEVEVYVLKVDREARKIALSLRRLRPEPWQTVPDRYQVGQVVDGTITKLTNFGAFARIEGSVEGLIHISELTERMVQHPKEVVRVGDVVKLRIIKMEPERRRLGLSMKQVEEPWEEQVESTEQ